MVANADDPLVAWAASTAPEVRWVGAGQVWHDDAVGCPACGGRIIFADRRDLGVRRVRVRPAGGAGLTLVGRRPGARRRDAHRLRIGLPGQFNRANAGDGGVAAAAVLESAGRGAAWRRRWPRLDGGRPRSPAASRRSSGGAAPVRLLLAKNPAGWTAIFDLLEETGDPGEPVVLSVNARTADGFDTRWLWDVPFERLAGRPVVATGERRLDLGRAAALRGRRPRRRRRTADGRRPWRGRGRPDGVRVEFLGNYTAFADLGGHCEPGGDRRLVVAVVYPDLLGTYGDGGNGIVLARRAAWRGIDVELVQATSDRPLPAGRPLLRGWR